MDVTLPLTDRLFALLFDQCGRWVCDRCLGDKLGGESPGIPKAIAELAILPLGEPER